MNNYNLKAYMDQELPENQMEAIKAKMGNDPELASEAQDFEKISESIKSYAKAGSPADGYE